MKKALGLIIFILLSTIAFSQEDYQDVVYLKNGSIIHGMIIEQVPNVSIKIQTNDRNVFFYKIEEVEKITKELKPSDVKQKNLKKQYPIKGIIAQVNYVLHGASVQANYLIHPFSIGIGVGVNKSYEGGTHVPFFLDGKFYFTNTRLSPLLACELGYSYIGSNAWGWHMNPYVGFKILLFNDVAINFGVGLLWERDYYYYHGMSEPYDHYEPEPDIKLGVSYRFGK